MEIQVMCNSFKDLLTDLDALIYVDTDVIFLTPPENLWDHFEEFKKIHIAALAPETEDKATNWYVRFARHPFYEPLGKFKIISLIPYRLRICETISKQYLN